MLLNIADWRELYARYTNSSINTLHELLKIVVPSPSNIINHQLLPQPYSLPYEADCFEGLCPTCLCEHTIKHSKMGSSPNYENIKDTQKRY